MSKPSAPLPVKGFASIIACSNGLIDDTIEIFKRNNRPLDMISDLFPFSHTDYYEKEMGRGLSRRFICFKDLISPDDLVDLKHYAFSVEQRQSRDGRRMVNIDPGYLAQEKIVLATFKNFSHRIYIGRGVYADLTLLYRKGRFVPLEWTFPDYREPEVQSFFKKARERYVEQLRADT